MKADKIPHFISVKTQSPIKNKTSVKFKNLTFYFNLRIDIIMNIGIKIINSDINIFSKSQ